jgi:hypothetical protein
VAESCLLPQDEWPMMLPILSLSDV